MIDKILSEIGAELGLRVTAVGIIGKTNGVLYSITAEQMNQYSVNIYIGEQTKRSADEILNKITKTKIDGLKTGRYNFSSQCIEVHFQFGILRGENEIKSILKNFLNLAYTLCPQCIEYEFDFLGEIPVPASKLALIKKNFESHFYSVWQRFGISIFVLFGMSFLSAILVSIEQIRSRFQPGALSYFTVLISMLAYFTKRKRDEKNLVFDFIVHSLIFIFSIAFSHAVIFYALKHAHYNLDFEVFVNHFNQLLTHQWGQLLPLLFVYGLLVFSILNTHTTNAKINTPNSILHAQSVLKKYSKRTSIFCGLGFLLLIASFSLIFQNEHIQNTVNFRPILGIGVFAYVFMGVFYFILVYKSEEHRSALKLIYNKLAYPFIIFTCILFPVLYSGATISCAMYLNSKLDKSEQVKKYGIVLPNRLKSATLAYCLLVQDRESGSILNFPVCSRDYGYIEGGEEVSYYYKPGLLNTGITFGQKVERPVTWNLLLEKKPDLSRIRISDFEPIWKNDRQNKLIRESISVEWQENCKHNAGAYCRFIAYAEDLKNNKEKAKEFYQLGCLANDYSACFGWRLIDSKNTQAILLHEELAQKACLEKNDISACGQYWSMWIDNENTDRRVALKEILEKLCRLGNIDACERILWEKHRK